VTLQSVFPVLTKNLNNLRKCTLKRNIYSTHFTSLLVYYTLLYGNTRTKNQILVYKGILVKNANVNMVLNEKTPYQYLKDSKHIVRNTTQLNMYKINLYNFFINVTININIRIYVK